MQTGREQTVVHAMFQWIFFLAPRHEKQPPQSPLSGGLGGLNIFCWLVAINIKHF